MSKLNLQVRFSESGVVSMWVEGLPIHSEATSFEVASTDLLEALRDYVKSWDEGLKRYSNQVDKGSLVRLVRQSTDEELREILFGEG